MISENDKDNALIILAFIVLGTVSSFLINLLTSYSEEIVLGWWIIMRIVIYTIIQIVSFSLIFEKIYFNLFSNDKTFTIITAIVLVIFLIISIFIEFSYGDIIVSWLKNYWYYLLGGWFVIIIPIIIIIYNKNNPTPN